MRKTAITLTALGLVSALAVTAAAPAEAHGWDHRGGYGWHEHHNAGAAIGLGILGAFAGAAIAASQGYAPPTYYASGAYYGAPYGYAGYGYYR